MATLGDLKARVQSETTRDDLADDLASALTLCIQKSIEQYAAVRWWFNERRILVPTVAGQGFISWPADSVNSLRVLDGVFLELAGGNRWPLLARNIVEWEHLTQPANMAGQPYNYLVAEDASWNPIIKLWPTPSSVWNIVIDGLFEVTPKVSADTDSNFWTNQGADLICAQTKIRLYRDYLSATTADTRLANAVLQETDAYSRLRAESNRRTTTGRVRASW
jgi:hypothetical protein